MQKPSQTTSQAKPSEKRNQAKPKAKTQAKFKKSSQAK